LLVTFDYFWKHGINRHCLWKSGR